ncbi:MAG: lytic transglycosylase domain-containing protein [Candidatus Doudnabacteria bacterium]|nr:lytic transglycosylase domain-containing protein [Candidatus Doudnabacteria bacterium]
MTKTKKIILGFLLLEMLLSYAPAYAQNDVKYDYSQGGTNPVSSQIEKYLCAPSPVVSSQTSNTTSMFAGMAISQQQAAANNANSGDLYRCINQLYKLAIVVASVAGVFMIVIAGYIYMSANGESESVTKAKNILETTITAIVILLAGYVLLRAINPDLIQFQPIQPPSVVLNNAVGGPSPTGAAGAIPTGAACGNTGAALCSGGTPDSSCNSTCNSFKSQIQQAVQGISISGVNNTAAFIQSIMSAESSCRAGQTSPQGACGLVQLLPSTASQYGASCGVPANVDCTWLNSSAHAVASICAGAKYLQSLSNGICGPSRGGNMENIIAGYNGGSGGTTPGACTPTVDCGGYQSCGGGAMQAWECPYSNANHSSCDKGYLETRQYVPKVMACYTALGGS